MHAFQRSSYLRFINKINPFSKVLYPNLCDIITQDESLTERLCLLSLKNKNITI